jgi:hypothetical protein
LDGTTSIRYGPHLVGRFDAEGKKLKQRPLPATKRSKQPKSACGSKEVERTLSRFPLRGQAE